MLACFAAVETCVINNDLKYLNMLEMSVKILEQFFKNVLGNHFHFYYLKNIILPKGYNAKPRPNFCNALCLKKFLYFM